MSEVLASDYTVQLLCGTPDFLREARHLKKAGEVIETSEKELTALGSVEANNAALAVVCMRHPGAPLISADTFTLALDTLSDPGNLGTIIRTADWYGCKQIIASEDTADVYSPKVINATMGSFIRISFHYVSLPQFLDGLRVPVYGAFLDGQDVHQEPFGAGGVIVVGNESRGISKEVASRVTHRITIPRYGIAESLNASVATAVILDNIRRRS